MDLHENIELVLARLESKECTDLDRYNIQMLASIGGFKNFIEREAGQKTEKDIQISRWPDGTHYYAKVSGIDVVGPMPKCEVKWNTFKEAERQAQIFLRELNQKL